MPKWTEKDRKFSKKVNFATKSKVGLMGQGLALKANIEKRYKNANTPDDCEAQIAYCEKQMALFQRKINGTEIKDKKKLQSIYNMYASYKQKFEAKKSSLGSKVVTESFIDFCDRMIIE